jgi:beta-RFAP synthase
MKSVVVTTGARLHFGLLAHGQPACREFGGIGVMIDRPGFVIRGAAANVDELACGAWHGRVEALLAKLRSDSLRSDGLLSDGARNLFTGPLRLEIVQAPPAHAGLGSGTQLGMAVAKLLSILAGEHDMPAAELAHRAGRGLRSALGLHGFQHGGLLVEAGQRSPGEISPLVARVDFPQHWRFVLARPVGASGLSGAEEINGFARLPPMAEAVTDRLCRIALMEILPSVIEHDVVQAGESIGRFGRLVGEYFAPIQGGVLADERMRRLAGVLESRNIHGFGQSSWGPTLFVLCPDADSASQLARDLAQDPAGAECEFTIARPRNQGANAEVAGAAFL